jgi:hypothetical protein
MIIGLGILCIVYGDVCLRYRVREKLLSTVGCRILVRVAASMKECLNKLVENVEFVNAGSVWLRSRVSPEVFHVWDLTAVNTVQHLVTQVHSDNVFVLDDKRMSITTDIGEKLDTSGVWCKTIFNGNLKSGKEAKLVRWAISELIYDNFVCFKLSWLGIR